VAEFDAALALQPRFAAYYLNRGVGHGRLGQYARAEDDYQRALQLDPGHVNALNNLAWLWATCPDPDYRDGARAVDHATRACQLSDWKEPSHLATLAAACAEAGDFAAAAAWQKKALDNPAYGAHFGEKVFQRVRLYEQGQPYREELTSKVRFV